MKLFGWEFKREEKNYQISELLQQFVAASENLPYYGVTPETCMQSPTVQAIVTAVSRRLAVSALHVYEKTTSEGGDSKKPLPNHPVARLLNKPNKWQTRSSYWLDAVSCFMRYGNYYAFKSRGSTGPIRELLPLSPARVVLEQDKQWKVTYRVDGEDVDLSKIHHVRSAARNFLNGDSWIRDVSQAISLEILAERFGAAFFQNGATPFLVFSFMAGNKGFKTDEERKQFLNDFQNAFGGNKRFRAMVAPVGIEKPTPIAIENDKAQFLETRKYQRTVIAGAAGVPPHLVGDLERATFNNVEQQDSDFTLNVVMPVAQAFEAAMERDLLTDEDRASGTIIRFNLDSILRADFKSRQEGLQIQRRNGVISSNEWREIEGKNPLSDDDGGTDYIHETNMVVAGEEPPPEPPKGAEDEGNSNSLT